MEGNEAYVFSMKTGIGIYLDQDSDGAAYRSYEYCLEKKEGKIIEKNVIRRV
jgi:hypothetical protein